MWRNNIDPAKVVMGLGFYGRSFQLANPSCTAPGCGFSGKQRGEIGMILSYDNTPFRACQRWTLYKRCRHTLLLRYVVLVKMEFSVLMQRFRAEIQNVISTTGVTPVWDKTAAVKYIVWDSNQWVSYDDADTFKQVNFGDMGRFWDDDLRFVAET